MNFLKKLMRWLLPAKKPSEMTSVFPDAETGREIKARPTQMPVTEGTNLAYRVYTREFDRIVDAAELDSVLGAVGAVGQKAHEEAWEAFQEALQGWRVRAHLEALETAKVLSATISPSTRADTVVTLLLDQSGSMRGQNILLAAAAIDVAQDFLRNLGCAVEVLGFTTMTWHGGKSRQKWLRAMGPPLPGRLCDLLHIIYRKADDLRTSGAGWAFKPMLRPHLLKENVDGEALEWAADRLRSCLQTRKILLVVSDGAPVDDSTLKANQPLILERHLRRVIAGLKVEGKIETAAIGIGHDVTRYYETAIVVQTPDNLAEDMISLLQRLLATPPAPAVTMH